MQYEKHYQESIFIPASPEDIFDYVDDHSNFYSHVIKFTKLLGGRMELQFDDGQGKSVSSHIRLFGNVLGKSLSLEEVVTKRERPSVKSWETVGTPNFLVVGKYQYTINIELKDKGSLLFVTFDFSPPEKSGWLRRSISNVYAKICAREMAKMTRKYFVKRHQHMAIK